ncbi:hydrolase [Pseudonocardia lacus]|uniref:hydrolase n=1 Tax=Pseudonocardia lacus TaxID=2835865 RepID=UPI001BDCD73A|nr:hydrolase [Pseudonocardia lacus]
MDTTFPVCATCAVEHAERVDVCRICDDERQWVPADGQVWTTLAELAGSGREARVYEMEPDLHGIVTVPGVGIGQTAVLVRTPAGNLLWDPIGYLDDALVERVRALGDVVAIAASHPHMFGVQVEWSRALGGPPVLVNEADADWVARPDPAIVTWTGRRDIAPGLALLQIGGHFPGSAVVHWAAGAGGKGVLLAGDTIMACPDRTSVSFQRSFPNRIPLSGAVVDRVAKAVDGLEYDRLYSNFGNQVPTDAHDVVRRSADRYIAWVRGDYDHLT